ncbi:MAG TPA: acetyl-CoA carboxylase biotin carboxyl carrier protein [Caldithrix abyssi]|uniref:Biotin carboxyl carrier protein of acetyl-CoA carboxylase n=1 Tax=Caldithrix abyssi TaxID=187145 RepID=A0A7V4U3I5_CALAY|nr:acetyl-CoA carboxylase biotin carboxyl carrier protein [Caldithrix abyssi]
MELKEIRQLIKIVEGSDISEFQLEEEGMKLVIKKELKSGNGTVTETAIQMVPAAVAAQPAAALQEAPVAAPAPAPPAAEEAPAANVHEVRSPMVGTFYRAPSPDADPYVEVGDSVSVGQTLCIVEAMKLMNEIESEVSGKIVKILVENAQPVEYNQVLFLIETA